jgi:CRP-like cAMP-binding protein
MCADYEPIHYPKSNTERYFLTNALQDNFIFMDLSDTERNLFIDAMQKETVEENTRIIQQGDNGDFFYIVQAGTVNFLDGEERVGDSGPGSSFGELALLYNSPRAVSCDAASASVTLWKVDQMTFRYLVARHAHGQSTGLKDLVRKISIFANLDDSTISRFMCAMTHVQWKMGDRIVQKGQVGTVFYIIQEGSVKCHDIGLGDSRFEDQTLGPGDWFGERALLTGEPRAANVTALSNVSTLAMDRETFEQSIGPLKCLMEREMRKMSLKGLPIFANSSVTMPEIDQLVDLMQEFSYAKGTKLAEAGKPYEMNLWIIRHGQLLVFSQTKDTIFNLKIGDYFGGKSVRGKEGHISSHNAVCEDNLTAWTLSRKDIESVIGDIERLGKPSKFEHSVQDKSILLGDLKKHRILGMGAFGKVWLVSHKHDDSPYALKAIGKRKLLESKQEDSVVREKELLDLLQHPFILHLVSSFQDESNLYLLLPLIQGGELFSVLHRRKGPKRGMLNSECAFYAGCVVEALGHFHQRLIAYRDLKLENVLIDADGYCKVIDLGFAKLVTDKTYTLVGTPEYLCPEIIMSKGHDKAVDYWAFGVLLYELLVGHSPFYIPHSSQIDMFKRSEYNNTRFELFAPSGFPVILDGFAVILTISLSLVSQWL